MIRFTKNILGYISALPFIFKNGLSKYFLLSGLISITIAVITIGGIYYYSDNLASILLNLYPFDWGKEAISNASNYISGGLLMAISFMLYKYILLICIGPFMGPLSEKVEQISVGTLPKQQGLKNMGYTFIRGLRITFRNLFRETFYSVLLIILGFVPVFAPISAIGLFLIQAYYLGFANLDYHLEKRLSVNQSVAYCKSHKMALLGNGTAYLLLILIPVLGLFLAPVLGTVSATREALKDHDY